jgi:hypothetical protein
MMKTNIRISFVLVCMIPLSACRKAEKQGQGETKIQVPAEMSAMEKDLADQDTPILPVNKGDTWTYKVRVEIPAGITSEASAAVDLEYEMHRVYLGKMKIGEREPEVDVFEVRKGSEPVEHELVEIFEDRILMRGTLLPEKADSKPLWLDPAVPFVIAGMRPGQALPPFSILQGASNRSIKVVARETVEVPAGKYPAIRILMTGNDEQFEIRRTTWFAPAIGIVKEEKLRFLGDKLLFRETSELKSTDGAGG